MEFPFGRQISKDSLLGKTGEAGRSIRSSITSGSSRLFDSVKAKKTGLFDGLSSGISNTFDQVMTIGGNKDDDPNEEAATSESQASPGSNAAKSDKPTPASRQTPTHQPQAQPLQPLAQPPPQTQPQPQPIPQLQPQRKPQPQVPEPQNKPQAPERTSRTPQPRSEPQKTSNKPAPIKQPPARPNRPPVPSPRAKSNGNVRGHPGTGKFSRQQTAPADFDPTGDRSDYGVNIDETLYGRQYSLRSGSVDLDQDSGFQDTTSSVGGSNTSPADASSTTYTPPVSTRISKNPFLNDPMPDPEFTTVFTRAEVHSDTPEKPKPQQRGISELDPMARVMQGGMGSDLLPGIPRVPSNNTALLAPQAQGQQDLLAITPTSGEALPMPSLQPTRRTHSDEIYDDSDGDSEATEGCDEMPDPEDYGGADYDYTADGSMLRSGSVGSEQSWNSSQSTGIPDYPLDELGRACRDFMREFVTKIFSTADGVTQNEKAQFGRFCQQAPGRLWFARYVNAQRASSKCTEEAVFYGLVQHFAVALFECNEADDFTPAKILMNMCFTFYLEVAQPKGPTLKHFLYSYLRDQAIWQSLRFWNASFFDAVQHERARRPVPTRGTGKQGETDDRHYQENITFGQLGTFTCNMRAFGLSKQLCIEFIRKQATIATLSNEQIAMLKENIER